MRNDILFLGMVFLFPLAVYCLFLGLVNRRPHPVMMPGPWDFTAALFAVSGFLLVGGPIILSRFRQQTLDWWLFSDSEADFSAWGWFWRVTWVLYFVAVLGISWYLLGRRQRETSIYNVETDVLDEAVTQVLERLQLPWKRYENRVYIGPSSTSPEMMVLTLERFPALCHVTLHWSAGHESTRDEVEGELKRFLADVWTMHNQTGIWFLSLACSLFSVSFFLFLFLVIRVYLELFKP